MNWLDFVLSIIVLGGVVVGFFQGLLRQVGGLASLYIGLVLASSFYGQVGRWLESFSPRMSEEVKQALGFLIILALAYGLLEWLFRRALPVTRLPVLGFFDQMGGVLLGFLATAAEVGVGLFIFQFLSGMTWVRGETLRLAFIQAFDSSRLVPLFMNYLSLIANLIQLWLPSGLSSFFLT